MKKIFLLLVLLTSLSIRVSTQEMIVEVTVNTPKLQTADPKVFESLERAIQEFMNNQKWTDDEYEEEERINVDIVINIREERGPTQFEGDLIIQSTRPVYGTTYKTPLLNHQDSEFLFEYEQFQPVEYTDNQFRSNLISTLAFYAFVTLGLDYDSFASNGGEKFYLKAQEIIDNIPPNVANVYKGWRSVDSQRNRYWIVENLLNPKMRGFRQALYDYHRQGLDLMHNDPVTGRAIITQALETAQDAIIAYPRAMIIQMFANAKSAEVIEIFKGGTSEEKDRVIKAMTKVDQPRSSTYRQIRS